MVYLARLPSGDVELRTERPTDTEFFVGPYTLAEIFHRLSPVGNPLNSPLLQSRPDEHAASHGLKPCHFHAKYDPETKAVILFDFAGYVGTVITQQNLWRAIVYQAENGPGSLRALSRVPDYPPGDRYISPEEQAKINKEIEGFAVRAAKSKVTGKGAGFTLEDLDL